MTAMIALAILFGVVVNVITARAIKREFSCPTNEVNTVTAYRDGEILEVIQ